MSVGPQSVFIATAVSGAGLTQAIDLGWGWRSVLLDIPTMTSNTQHQILASDRLGGTYARVYQPAPNTASIQANFYKIVSGVTNEIVPIPAGLRYIKIEQTAPSDGAVIYRIICGGE